MINSIRLSVDFDLFIKMISPILKNQNYVIINTDI